MPEDFLRKGQKTAEDNFISFKDFLSWFGIGEFLPSNLLMDCLASLFCHEGVTQVSAHGLPVSLFCDDGLTYVGGHKLPSSLFCYKGVTQVGAHGLPSLIFLS